MMRRGRPMLDQGERRAQHQISQQTLHQPWSPALRPLTSRSLILHLLWTLCSTGPQRSLMKAEPKVSEWRPEDAFLTLDLSQ